MFIMQSKSQNKIIRKAGRTLVIKSETDIPIDGLTGLVSNVKSNESTYFLLFDTIENSKEAFKILKTASFKVRYAYYRIFFTMSGLSDEESYNNLKEQHIKWITANTDGQVLYYKQYRNGGKFLGCGDFTIDTKESMDKLLDKDGLKNYAFDSYTGINYRYNKKNDKTQEQSQKL